MTVRRLVACALAGLLGSCSGSGSPSPPRTSAAAAIAAADGLFFASRYAAAERAYRAAVGDHPSDPDAHAALALYENYEQQPAAALEEARTGVRLGPRDGYAQAVLCRVHDWANRLDDALAACRRAVSVSPAAPLGHLFLAEALADRGQVDQARSEIARARGLIPPDGPAYLRAEVPREEANLAHDIGDVPGRIAALTAAAAIQPLWIQRATELVSGHLEAQDLPHAQAAVAAALAAVPEDPPALEELGSAALSAVDYRSARILWSRALALAPRDPKVLALNGHLAVVLDHDIDAAQRLFERALEAAPGDQVAAAYLLAVARYLRGDEAAGRQAILQASRRAGRAQPVDPDAVQLAHASAALGEVNARRRSVGLPAVALDPHLGAAAVAHCFYWLFNNTSPTLQNLGMHRETPGFTGYHGASPYERDRAAGYAGDRIGEDITHRDDPVKAVDDWVDSVYHRFPILRPDLQVIGYGDAGVTGAGINDMEFGFGPPAAPASAPILYPPDGLAAVPASFLDNEVPDPLPAGAPRVSGYPVTATFPPEAPVRLRAFTLAGPDGVAMAAHVLPPGPDNENSASLLTGAPLAHGTRYVAQLSADVGKARYERTWSFTTG